MDHTLEVTYRALAPSVTGYFRSHGARDPEDLTGDVFERVAGALPKFRGNDAALRRWVFTIAHHRLVDEYRSSSRGEVLSDAPEGHVDAARLADMVDDATVDADLIDALGTLSLDQREVIVLRFVADLAVRDVAKIVEKRPGAVKMLQNRGLEALRTATKKSPDDA